MTKVIRLAYDFNLLDFQTLFPEILLFDEKRDEGEKIDLMIFPGGSDVSLEYYLDFEDIKKFQGLCSTSKERDDIERKILRMCLKGTINVNKILGVCRGCQFLNVMFGGTLFPDLASFGIAHESYHGLHFATDRSNLGWIKAVNSLHHQGLRYIGEYYKELDLPANPKVIATDTEGNCLEIVTWFNDKILGVQFHPEYYLEQLPDKDNFRQFIYNWIDNKTTIMR